MDTKIVITDTEDGLEVEQFFKDPDEPGQRSWEKNPDLDLDFRELGHIGHSLRMDELNKKRGKEDQRPLRMRRIRKWKQI